MIAHRDFLFSDWGYRFWNEDDEDDFERAVSEVNEWVARESVDVINVETIPSNKMWKSMIRVWYRATDVKATNIPEV